MAKWTHETVKVLVESEKAKAGGDIDKARAALNVLIQKDKELKLFFGEAGLNFEEAKIQAMYVKKN